MAGDSLRFDELGAANGIAQLDGSVLVPEAQVPHTLANLLTLNGGAQLGAGLDANGQDITGFSGIEAITTGTSHIQCSFDQVMWIQGASTVRLEIRGGGATAPAGAFIFHTPNLGGTKTERVRIEGNLDVVDVVWSSILHKGFKSDPMVLNPSAEPGAPEEGQFYYDSTAKKLKVYNGTAWEEVTSS